MTLRKRAVVIAVAALGCLAPLDHGITAEPPFLGLQVQGMTPVAADAIGMTEVTGVLIRDVALEGPAGRAGVRRGDVILEFRDEKVSTVADLVAAMGGVEAGESVPMTIQRGAERLDVTLQAISKPPTWRVEKGETAGVTSVGLTLSAITQKIREKLELRWSSTGVAVIQVDPAKLPKTLKLALGDVIVQVNQDAVWSPNQVIDHLRAATEAKRRALLLLVEGTGGFRFELLPVPQ